ncbi:MAG: hypothetical protein D6694_12485 [Gammaproteobacteria bacterium]|nr:MAG: hypothetical protein D6694_12485 [Gammaproteobacteria bacterium]
MIFLILFVVLVLFGLFALKNLAGIRRIMVSALAFVGASVVLVTMSSVWVGEDEVGHLKRIYFASDLPEGRIIGLAGQKGPQAEILGPGYHFIPFGRVIYDIEMKPVVEVPPNNVLLLHARDGAMLRPGQVFADAWPEDKKMEMLDATYFLTEGRGQKGPQLTVLPPGRYRFNHYLFKYQLKPALVVEAGQVAVIRSAVKERDDCPDTSKVKASDDSPFVVPLVPKGCPGVWDTVLTTGIHYINPIAYKPTIVPTRAQVWTYKGGYTKRDVKLEVGEDGKIHQSFVEESVDVPDTAAGPAINVRVEGWTVPVEVRVLAYVEPASAPRIVAGIGGINEVKDKVITPLIRDMLRTIGGTSKVLDFVNNRDGIAKRLESHLRVEAAKAGVTLMEVRLGEPAIPPELMVATLREQLANQLKATYAREREAQKERIAREREKATADQQAVLVAAEIAKEAAKHNRDKLKLEGEGEKLKLMQIAEGQKAQARVLGEDRVMQLQMLKEFLEVAKANPDIVKVPVIYVGGESKGSLNAAAAILGGASNLAQLFKLNEPSKTKK